MKINNLLIPQPVPMCSSPVRSAIKRGIKLTVVPRLCSLQKALRGIGRAARTLVVYEARSVWIRADAPMGRLPSEGKMCRSRRRWFLSTVA